MIYLYIKMHKDTKLKYFGKTIRKDYNRYNGSGTYWIQHLNKHGRNVITLRVWQFHDLEECKTFALKFSSNNKIVESKHWANLVEEDATNGYSRPGRRNPMWGKNHSILTKEKISKKKTEINLSSHWYNDGIKNSFSSILLTSPWKRGRLIATGSKWYNDGKTQTHRLEHPGEGWVEGPLQFKLKWFTDGVTNIRAYECPPGWKPGSTQRHNRS